MSGKSPTAAVLIIGNEILSGRTQDTNLNAIAVRLAKIGVRLSEARVVADVEQDIVDNVNLLRARYTYVFTTGGIGPTHDDITTDSIARAFRVNVVEHPEARALLAAYYPKDKLTAARLRMARIPEGADLIENSISLAPGFRLGNVYVMAGVPDIMRVMMDSVLPTLEPGPAIYSKTVSAYVAESVIAEALKSIALSYPQIDVGSYPWVKNGHFGTSLVSRGTDPKAVDDASQAIYELVVAHDKKAMFE